jgi:hypothetical protein
MEPAALRPRARGLHDAIGAEIKWIVFSSQRSSPALLLLSVPDTETFLSSEQSPMRLVVAGSIEKLEDWK